MFWFGLIVSLIVSEPYTYQDDRIRFLEEEAFFICRESCPIPFHLTPRTKREEEVRESGPPPDPLPVGPVKTSLLFRSGSAVLEESSRLMLDLLIGRLKRFAPEQVRIEITGYTDAQGTPEVNERLAWNRAEAVADYLKGNGVHPERMTLAGKPRCCYRGSNETAEGREKNRRVEIYVEVPKKETMRPMDP